MRINSLDIHNVRNIELMRMRELVDVNLIHGVNGSGKTSVLEAIHFLSVTRSFRSRAIKTVISRGAESLTVRGELRSPADAVHTLAVQRRQDNKAQVRLNGNNLKSFGELAGVLPVQLINPDSFKLLEGGPAERRQFLDWPMFHVEHSGFFEAWSRYRRALTQRNALLRRGRIQHDSLMPWTRELAQSGEQLHQIRCNAYENLAPLFKEVMTKLVASLGSDQRLEAPMVELAYSSGWDSDYPLIEVLQEKAHRDAERGHTSVGPHRADIHIKASGMPASDTLSRGQLKTVVCALKIAQAKWLLSKEGLQSLFLIDDLAAELDQSRRKALLDEVLALRGQIFASSIEPEQMDGSWFVSSNVKRFHVEHGHIQPLLHQ